MKKILLPILLTIISLNLFCQEKEYDFLIDTTYSFNWDDKQNEWINNYFEIYMYDTAGNLTEDFQYNWDLDSYKWTNYEHYVYKYDTSGNLSEEIRYIWDSGIDDWINSVQTIYTYDTAGNLTEETFYSWDSGIDDWDNSSQNIFTYDTAGNQTAMFRYFWRNDDWENFYQRTYTYDTAGNQTEYYRYNWDPVSSVWVNNNHNEYLYDDFGNLIEDFNYRWDPEFYEWESYLHTLYTYDTIGNNSGFLGYQWNLDFLDWEIYYRGTYVYDNFGNQTAYYYYYWDTENNQWLNSSYHAYSYKPIGKHLAIIPSKINFGKKESGGTPSTTEISLNNIGTVTLTINNISPPDSIFSVNHSLLPITIKPGMSEAIEVTFSPNDTVDYADTIFILCNDQNDSVKAVLLSGEGIIVLPADSGVCYASTGNKDGGRLITINPSTGEGTLIGPTGLGAVPGIAINSSGVIYGTDSINGDLYRIDAVTGTAVFDVQTNLGKLAAMAFDTSDVLYAINEENLIIIDIGSGFSMPVGNTEESLKGIAFNPVNGSLWGISAIGDVYTINTENGALTHIGNTGLQSLTPDLQFDVAGNLFAVSGGDYGINNLISIDKNTGKGTVIGSVGFKSVSGMAFYNVPVEGKYLRLIPVSLGFGIVEVGDSSEVRLVTFSNIGNEDLTIDMISAPVSAFELTHDLNFPKVISPAGSVTLEIRFIPTDTKLLTDTIIISCDDPDHLLATVLLTGKGMVFMPADSGVCYAAMGNTDAGLLNIDVSTGEGTFIGTTTLHDNLYITINSDGQIFGATNYGNDLYRIDAGTGMAFYLTTADFDGISALAFDSSNVLYAISSSSLYTIDLSTGESNYIGNTGPFSGIAFDPVDGNLWGIKYGSLYTINVETGKTVYIGYPNISGSYYDLGFDFAGNLYAVMYNYNSDEYELIRIDTNTGNGTVIGEIGFQNVTGLAFYKTPMTGLHLRVVPDSIDFGIVELGYENTISVSLSNTGTEEVTIDSITYPVGPYSITDVPEFPIVIESGFSVHLEITFIPVDCSQEYSSVTIFSNYPLQPETEVSLYGKGTTSNCPIVQIDKLYSHFNNIIVYPNPFTYKTTIQIPNSLKDSYMLIVTDLSGKVCRIVNDINTSEYVLEKKNLKEGFYFIELRGPKIYRGKIVIE
jgi:streptogramin lyase